MNCFLNCDYVILLVCVSIKPIKKNKQTYRKPQYETWKSELPVNFQNLASEDIISNKISIVLDQYSFYQKLVANTLTPNFISAMIHSYTPKSIDFSVVRMNSFLQSFFINQVFLTHWI